MCSEWVKRINKLWNPGLSHTSSWKSPICPLLQQLQSLLRGMAQWPCITLISPPPPWTSLFTVTWFENVLETWGTIFLMRYFTYQGENLFCRRNDSPTCLTAGSSEALWARTHVGSNAGSSISTAVFAEGCNNPDTWVNQTSGVRYMAVTVAEVRQSVISLPSFSLFPCRRDTKW